MSSITPQYPSQMQLNQDDKDAISHFIGTSGPRELSSICRDHATEVMNAGPASNRTAAIVKEMWETTGNCTRLAVSPEFSFFFRGLEFLGNTGGDYNPNGAIGALMLIASPVGEPLRILIGAVGAVVSAVVTAASSVVYGAQKTRESIAGTAVEDADNYRRAFTKLFIDRMIYTCNDSRLSHKQKKNFRDNPKELIAMGVFAVAFRSRTNEGKAITTSNGIIDEQKVVNQPQVCKDYFNSICEIKEAIKELNLSQDDAHAWKYLCDAFESAQKGLNISNIYEPYKVERFITILEGAKRICCSFVDDDYFKEEWAKSSYRV